MTYTGGDFELAIVCTDRGQHKSRDLGRVVFTPHSQRLAEFRDYWPVDGGFIGLPLVRQAAGRKAGQYGAQLHGSIEPRYLDNEETRGGLRVTCPTCNYDLPLNQQNLTKIVFGFRDAGLYRLDISV